MSNEDELAIPSESLLQEIQTNEDTSEVLTQNIGVSDGDFRGSQLGGTRVYEYKTEYNAPVYNMLRNETQTQRSQVQGNKDFVQLSDTIRMFKNKKVKSESESKIFLGEQTSGVTGSRPIAVKLLEYSEKTIQEAKNLLMLVENPNVVSIVHSDRFEQAATSHVYIAMELCDTQNLYDYVTESRKDTFDPKLSISQATQIVSGLDFIHENDIIHRDLKPHNVLFSLQKKILKIADFGLSKQMVSGRSVTKVVNPGAGTDGYRAPETYNRDEISKNADVYSLGLTCYFLWSRGKHPFGEDPDDWNSNIKKNRNRDLSQLTLLPDAAKAQEVIEAMLKFEPKQRPTTKEILEDVFFSADARARPVLGERSEDRIRPESQLSLNQTGPSSYLELQHESRGGAQSIKTTAVTRSKSVGSSSEDTKFENPPWPVRSVSLPERDHDSDIELTTEDYKSLCSCFDVVTTWESKGLVTGEVCRKGIGYLMGGVLDGDVIVNGEYYIERDILQDAKKIIEENFLRVGKSGIVPIYHPPGEGGTTLANTLLWKLRNEASCIILKEKEHELKPIEEGIKLLHSKSKLPVVLAVDAHSRPSAQTILNCCRYEHLVILNLQRSFEKPEFSMYKPPEAVLTKGMSPGEKRLFKRKFSVLAGKPNSHLKLISETAFFVANPTSQGYENTVDGVLDGSPREIHALLTCLSFAYYYGHCGIPRALLDPLLSVEDNLEKYRNVIVKDEFDTVRICHYRAARYVRRLQVENQDIPLGKRVFKMAIAIIKLLKCNKAAEVELPVSIDELLARIFIKKDYQYFTGFDGKCLSFLLEETESHENQKQILEEVVQCSPENGEFHANLGRLHALSRDFILARQSFETARNLGKKNGEDVLHRILNMNGCFLHHQFKSDIASFENGNSNINIPEILKRAFEAIEHFQQGQRIAKNCRMLGCSYVGEINVRLDIIHLAIAKSNQNNESEDLSNFAVKSFIQCDLLLHHCLENAQQLEISTKDVNKCLFELRSAYAQCSLINSAGQADRCRLFMLRTNQMLKVNGAEKFCIYDVDCLDTVEKYKACCTDIVKSMDFHNWDLQSSLLMVEWLQAIRCPLPARLTAKADPAPTLQTVATKLEICCEPASLCVFYRYVVDTVRAINEKKSYNAFMKYNKSSNDLRKQLRGTFIPYCKMEKPIEWLINCEKPDSFSNVVHNCVSDKKKYRDLRRLCNGTIQEWETFEGCIELTGNFRSSRAVPKVSVYFNPRQYGAINKLAQGNHVQFYIGFNPKYGAQAYDIRSLDNLF